MTGWILKTHDEDIFINKDCFDGENKFLPMRAKPDPSVSVLRCFLERVSMNALYLHKMLNLYITPSSGQKLYHSYSVGSSDCH